MNWSNKVVEKKRLLSELLWGLGCKPSHKWGHSSSGVYWPQCSASVLSVLPTSTPVVPARTTPGIPVCTAVPFSDRSATAPASPTRHCSHLPPYTTLSHLGDAYFRQFRHWDKRYDPTQPHTWPCLKPKSCPGPTPLPTPAHCPTLTLTPTAPYAS